MASRRRFLATVLAASLPATRRADATAWATMDAVSRATLDAAVETIVPRDTTPGALDVGVPERIIARLARDSAGEQLYRDGLALLETLARESAAGAFRTLDLDARERIVRSLDKARPQGLGLRFFRRLRLDVLTLYWASPQAQAAVGYRPPLSGYPEYADPPDGTRARR